MKMHYKDWNHYNFAEWIRYVYFTQKFTFGSGVRIRHEMLEFIGPFHIIYTNEKFIVTLPIIYIYSIWTDKPLLQNVLPELMFTYPVAELADPRLFGTWSI